MTACRVAIFCLTIKKLNKFAIDHSWCTLRMCELTSPFCWCDVIILRRGKIPFGWTCLLRCQSRCRYRRHGKKLRHGLARVVLTGMLVRWWRCVFIHEYIPWTIRRSIQNVQSKWRRDSWRRTFTGSTCRTGSTCLTVCISISIKTCTSTANAKYNKIIR